MVTTTTTDTMRAAFSIDGFQRDAAAERRSTDNPIVCIVTLLALAGIAVAAYGIVNQIPTLIAAGLPSAIVFTISVFTYIRFRPVPCSCCQQSMKTQLIEFRRDLLLGGQRFAFATKELDGRHYQSPTAENDKRIWVKLMMRVRVCEACRRFVWQGGTVEQTCTAEELEALGPRKFFAELSETYKGIFKLPSRLDANVCQSDAINSEATEQGSNG